MRVIGICYAWIVRAPADPRADAQALRVFIAIARQGTVGRAARLLGRSQPSVSVRLANLESDWRTRLFRREARGMQLTPEGARLLPRAERALRQLEELDRAAGLPVAHPGQLRLGAGDALGRELLPRALAKLQRRHAELDVYLREGPGSMLLQAVRDAEIDLALVVLDGPAPEGIQTERCLDSAVHLLAPKGTLAAGRTTSIRAVARRTWVSLQPGSGFRNHIEAAFASIGQTFRPTIEVGNLSLVRRFVAAGLGVAAVPSVAFRGEEGGAGVERRRLSGVPAVTYHRAARAGVPLPPIVAELIELLP